MSADEVLLSCPVCTHTGVFNSVQSLRDRLIYVSTNKIVCPICQDEVYGLDKLTIHLFSHVKILSAKGCHENSKTSVPKGKFKSDDVELMVKQKNKKNTVIKNKSVSPISVPVKFVKIFPKLPVISLNTVPLLDISIGKEQVGEPMFVKTETTVIQTNNICNVCGLQFIDANILRMHRCLIHNIDENSDQTFTRYNCHLCPKNFKMRGSLMVHLRVAHFGFLSGNCNSESSVQKLNNGSILDQQDEKPTSLERNDNKQWQCEVCRKCFTTKYFLKKHKRLHTGETPYACIQCNKTFTFQQSYHKHLLYHNDEKPHTCTYCGRAFKELSTLHNHQRIHTGEKPFSCETCGKCFRQRVSYLVHRRIHTGVMPYKCTACQKSFRYKVSQRTHKCQAQPPGTVVRQSGELVEKLKKKHEIPYPIETDVGEESKLQNNLSYTDVSEANAELVRTGAKLSLEDMESEHFSIIADVTENVEHNKFSTLLKCDTQTLEANSKTFSNNIDTLFDSIPIEDKDVPSPSEILKNLCLSNEENYTKILNHEENDKTFDISKDFSEFL